VIKEQLFRITGEFSIASEIRTTRQQKERRSRSLTKLPYFLSLPAAPVAVEIDLACFAPKGARLGSPVPNIFVSLLEIPA
jgi:hypothetical protein